MIPTIAIVGKPNVGKSTLFNCLTKTRNALVANQPGLTRDRQYGYGSYRNKNFIVIDTGGIGDEENELDRIMAYQAKQAILESDIILFLVDARNNLTATDEIILKRLRGLNKPCTLVLNKTDGINPDVASAEFHSLGFGTIYPISATHNRGIHNLLADILKDFQSDKVESSGQGIKLAVIGRPNVGKSTLINRILGEERVTVFDKPGTTRDSIFIPLERNNQHYTLIDTAGVRRRGKVKNIIEKFSIIKTLQAIEAANVIVFLIDARENIVDQDLKLLGFILGTGKSLVIAVNKWDKLSTEYRREIKSTLQRRLVFLNYVDWHFISALHGTKVWDLFKSINKAYDSAMKKFSTSLLNNILEKALLEHQPPLAHGRRIKLRYTHLGGHNPPVIVVHGNQLNELPESYRRYLENTFRKKLKLRGTPIRIEFKNSKNPFA